jgi:hypothetical protein
VRFETHSYLNDEYTVEWRSMELVVITNITSIIYTSSEYSFFSNIGIAGHPPREVSPPAKFRFGY